MVYTTFLKILRKLVGRDGGSGEVGAGLEVGQIYELSERKSGEKRPFWVEPGGVESSRTDLSVSSRIFLKSRESSEFEVVEEILKM